MKRLKYVVMFCLMFVLITGCGAAEVSQSVKLEPTETETIRVEEPTPEDVLLKVLSRLKDEVRIFDVQAHHESLYDLILSLEKDSGKTIQKSDIYDIVETYMDDYFWHLTQKVLSEYNENYALEDAQIIFEQTSRTGLYDLITLYEWTFYNKK